MSSTDAYLKAIATGKDLTTNEAEQLLGTIIDDPAVTDEQITEMLTSLTRKSPTVDEIFGFVQAMKARMIRINSPSGAIDMCGTGGDKSGTFNISTAASIVVAASGVPVAKHGNRAATSKCGSADVLEALNVPIDLQPNEAERSLIENNFVFLFAPLYHPSLKRMTIIRKQLGFPTVFNLLGPLLNPASVRRQIIGTYSQENCELLTQVAMRLRPEHMIILTSGDGLDEAGINAPVHIYEVRGDLVDKKTVTPKQFGFDPVEKSQLLGGTPEVNAEIIAQILNPASELTPKHQVVLFNAGLGLYVSGKADNISGGIEAASKVLRDGKAHDLLTRLRSEQ